MNLRKFLLLPAGIAALALSGCWDPKSQDNNNPTAQTTDFSTIAEKLVTGSTCDNLDPIMVNSVDFTFAADQDTTAPADVNGLTQGCSS